MPKKPNPFAGSIPGRPQCQTVDADGRIRMIQEFNLEQCNQALHVPGIQKTVGLAILRRVRHLAKEKKRGN